MILSESTTIEKVSPNQAKLWLDTCKYENQRKLRQYWVDFLSSEMEKGRFMPSAANIQFCFCMEDNGAYLVNGQHTLNAIVKSGVMLDGVVIVRTIADTLTDVSKLYIAIDKQSKRTVKDALHAFGVEKKWEIGREAARALSTAGVWIENEFSYLYHKKVMSRKQLSDLDRYNLAQKWLEDYKRFDNAISPCESDVRQKLHFGGILSVALVTFRYKPLDAMVFWKQVAQDDGLKIGDPRKSLRKWIMGHASTKASKNIETVHPDAFPRAVAKCWSKWMAGEEVRNIRTDYTEKMEDSLFGITREEIVQHYNTISS